MPEVSDAHYKMVARAIADGRVIPFLGAGINLCDRPPAKGWSPHQFELLPSGSELAKHLAENFGYPPNEIQDLPRVSQYVTVMMGSGPLYDELHMLFDGNYPPTPLHEFFATLPQILQEKGYPRSTDPLRRQMVIVTTNYDDLLERAFHAANQPFHLISYIAEGEHRGKFLHWPPTGWPPASRAKLIESPNQYRDLLVNQSPIILKIHGAVDRVNAERDSYVITEDHYINYLTQTDIASLIPVPLPAKLKKSHLLFLGYGLRDWNLRVILHRIWGEQRLSWKSWAIQIAPDPLDEEFWRKRGVDILNEDLKTYIARLREQVQALTPVGDTA